MLTVALPIKFKAKRWISQVADPKFSQQVERKAGIVISGKSIRKFDLAFISRERLKAQPDDKAALVVAPELMVEIMSPRKKWEDVMTKVDEYFAVGVDEVWLVSSALRKLFRHRQGEPTVEFAGDAKVPADVVAPGKELALEELFGKS